MVSFFACGALWNLFDKSMLINITVQRESDLTAYQANPHRLE